MSTTRQFKINLTSEDSQYLKQIADQLGVSESEVIRKGLKLMSLYAKSKDPDKQSAIIFRDGENHREILVL